MLVAQSSGEEEPVHWWTNQVMDNIPLSLVTANPLSPNIIARLPEYLRASTDTANQPERDVTHDVTGRLPAEGKTRPIKLATPATSTVYGSYASITDQGSDLLFLDWNEREENSLLPRMTLITGHIPEKVTLRQLSAISETQPQQPHPYTRLAGRAAHDLMWLMLAYGLDSLTSSAGDGIFSWFTDSHPRVNFQLSHNAEFPFAH